MLKCTFKRAWRTFVHSMLCICDSESINFTFVNKNRSYHSITIVAIQSFLAGTRNLIVGLVLCTRWLWCFHWDEIPGPGQGWRVGGTVLHLVGVCFLQTEEHKNKRFHWMLKCTFMRAWRTFEHSMLCICDSESINSTFVNKNRSYHSITIALYSHSWLGPRMTCVVFSLALVFPLR